MPHFFVINSGLRFILELISILVLLWIGFNTFKSPLNYFIGIIFPFIFILLWAIFIAPSSLRRANHFIRFSIEILIFSSIAYLIYLQVNQTLGVSYFIFSLLNTLLNHIGDYQQKIRLEKHL